jgi:glutamyl-tRNA synthetase
MEELIDSFSSERINKSGTKFDFDKAKWFNQEYIKSTPSSYFASQLVKDLEKHKIITSEAKAIEMIELLKSRVTFPHEFVENSLIFFNNPEKYDEKVVEKKWDENTPKALNLFAEQLEAREKITEEEAKTLFWETLESNGFKPGQFMQTLRLSMTGEGSGPDLMTIIEIMGPKTSADRIKHTISVLSK